MQSKRMLIFNVMAYSVLSISRQIMVLVAKLKKKIRFVPWCLSKYTELTVSITRFTKVSRIIVDKIMHN